MDRKRSTFSGKLGFVLSAAGASVGLGNIWRFPYLAAKYGGGIFLLIYVILALTFGYTMIVAETSIGRASGKSPVGAFRAFSDSRIMHAGGWLNAVISILIVPYYSVIGGWVLRYLFAFAHEDMNLIAQESFFTSFLAEGWTGEFWFLVFSAATLGVIILGVKNGIEKVSGIMMPMLVVMAVIICVYTVTRPGAVEGVKYFLIPDFSRFSWMTVVSAMGQMFYSLSISMGILITFGSYMKKEVSIDDSTRQVEIFDTGIAMLAGLMIIPAVFAFSGADAANDLNAGPSLMFITMPRIFASLPMGRGIAAVFFLMIFFAALTSSIALCECAVSTFSDEFGWSRRKGTAIMGGIILFLGTLSCLGYGPLSSFRVIGMQFLDFFDFLTNSLMMPVSALAICVLVVKYMSVERVEEEVTALGGPFRRREVFRFMISHVCPVFAVIILLSSLASAFGIVSF
ncbi:MAG: sodium-dependent transporter [Solobacterium sp.]|nr:sodium-dependent transporter [Solobacterium sp.]